MTNNRYPSKYSNGKNISAAQYITEMICEKKAKKDKVDIHYRFWLSKEWSGFYRNQIASANKLLLKYDDMAIIKALSSPKMNNIYSLRYPNLENIIREEQSKLDAEAIRLEESKIDYNRVDQHSYRKQFKKTKSIISKIEEMDNERN